MKNSTRFILLTTFLNFLGFTIIIPVIPFLVQQFSSAANVAFNVGMITSSYALCQFLAAPGLGMLSDRFGRRPILLISLAGSVVGYIIFGIGGSLWMLFLGRIIDGLTGGNISTIYAYIADVTEPKDRGKIYGLAGAAGGIGFMVGPAIGGLAANISLSAPLFIAAGVTFLNIIWGYFALPESLKPKDRINELKLSHLNPFGQLKVIFSIKLLQTLFLVTFLFFVAATALQSNASLYMKDILQWGPGQVGFILFIVGVIDIVAQGYLTGKLLPIFGETKLAIIGLILNGLGFLLFGSVAFFPSALLMYISTIVFVLGDGLFEPAISGMIANSVEPKMQGRIQGASQGIQSVARIIGPLYAAWLYGYSAGLPYLTSAIIIAVCLLVVGFSLSTIAKHKFHA